MIVFRHKGNFDKTEKFLNRSLVSDYMNIMRRYGEQGVKALEENTPVDSGKTSQSWNYEIRNYRGGMALSWINTNIVDGVPVAILIQYGHGTSNGGYVQGRDYINPALRSIFDGLARDLWEEVIR
jgi:hypothetical protein